MKYNLSEIMKLAWQFVKFNGFGMAEAMKQSWLHFKLKMRMKAGIVKFYFQKVNGDIREAYGTLCERLMPVTNGESRYCPTVQTYFDTEVQEFRRYKLANLLRIA